MEEIKFSYDFEITKSSLQNCLLSVENNTLKLGDATIYYLKMALASLTLLENAFKGIDFNFSSSTIQFLQQLFSQISKTNEKDYNVYCELLGAYFGWCAVKQYNAYFATYENNYCLIANNNAYSPKHLIQYAIENNKNLLEIFNELNN